MNLADITTKCYILALIIRDDGERLLLGDGAYEFKDSQQHFIANTYANDVVELQGTDGQMLAGQVRRTATQTFAGYIGDATFSKQAVESARRDFLMFFRKKHYYTAVYVFSDGTAIQRDRGYIVNAPSVPELYQRFPEWSVGLNFEDPNYYEYAEDDLGHEIAAHKVELELSTAMSGGLIWDGDGAVSDDLSYVGTEIPGEGKNFQLADTGTATLKSAELLGDAEQNGTPTPDAPVAVNTVTGEQTVTITGKNLFGGLTEYYVSYCTYTLANNILTITPADTTHNPGVGFLLGTPIPSGTTVHLSSATSVGSSTQLRDSSNTLVANFGNGINTTRTLSGTAERIVFNWLSTGSATPFTVDLSTLQIEVGSTATTYEPYQEQSYEINLGKNLNGGYPNSFSVTRSGVDFTNNADGTILASGTATDANALSMYAANASTAGWIRTYQAGTYTLSGGSSNISVFLSATDGSTSHSTNFTSNSITFTLTEPQTAYIRIQVKNGATVNETVYPQLELGSTATSYAPYFTPIELAKIPDTNYRDRIYEDGGKWYVEKQVGKVVLDGSEANWGLWGASTTNTLGARVTAITPAIKDSGSYGQGLLLSDYFTETTNNALYATDEVGIATTSSNLYFRIAKASLSSSDLAGWQAWLASNPTTVYYALATPTTTEITNSELVGQLERLQHAHTYADTTNFSITATSPNLPAFIKVVAFGDDAIPQGGYVWEDGGTGGATTITVDGVDNAQPIWTVVGPATNPSLTNITTGESIQWTGVVPNGQTLVVNMADMTASLSGANVFEFISGSWITLQAGNNRVSYSATAATGIATLEWNGVVG